MPWWLLRRGVGLSLTQCRGVYTQATQHNQLIQSRTSFFFWLLPTHRLSLGMGSSGGGAGSNERWWENPKLSPADLRQHSETWSLADDAAMATLLQGISQRLVSRTHEVEGALERALEDTDRIVTTIANTNNAFHMLANTQFIENRTYQDDADIVREKKEVSEKPAVTEEDILARCRMAIADGLNLVARSYERHEIQDSDSDDEDSPGSPVPVYALIDPYENKPLPLIIGSEGFLSDDKVGLEISSSEENSRMTSSPEDTESEGELEDETDRVAQKQKAIPASSSMAVDEDSDSEWSADDVPLPDKSTPALSKQKPLQLSSDEDDDMFGPSFRKSEKVGNIFSQKNNAGTTIPTTHINSKRAGADLDSDSEEDEGLFGKQQRPSGLFDGLRQPSNSQGSSKDSDSLTPSAPSKSLGVENVRAMPDVTPTTASGPVKSKKKESNLFASDSDDEGDLFSSKPAPSGKTTNSTSHNQGEPQLSNSGGLFSSDEDSPLFSDPSPTQGSKNIKEDNAEPPPQPKESAKKVPVGGVSIFGTAITSALRRQQSSDDEPSDDEVPNVNNTKDALPPPSKPDDRAAQKLADVKMPVASGLFDSDEDENLFDTLVRKPPLVTNDAEKTLSSTVPSLPENKTKDEERKSHIDNESASNLGGKGSIAKSTAGLFSDEEDDIFGTPTTVKNKDISLPGSESLPETSAKLVPEASKPAEEAVRATRPPSLFTPPDYQIPSEPVTISAPPKSNHSLFSSPSDDDDDIFSSISKPVYKTSHASAFVTDPPPLPPQSSTSQTEPSSKGPTQIGAHDHTDINRSIKVGLEENPKESVSSSLFSSTSDEDIFSSVTPHKNSPQIPAPEACKKKTEFLKSGEPELGTKTAAVANRKSTSHSEMVASEGIFHSPADSIFKSILQSPNNESKQGAIIDQSDGASEGLYNSFPKNDANIGANGADSKDDNIFDSTDDLFGVTKRLQDPDGSSEKKEDTYDPLKPDTQPKANSGASVMASVDAVNPVTSRLLKEDNSDTPNKRPFPSTPSSQSKPSHAGTQEPEEIVTKPPVGGVALFGGKELAAQINKRKTLLEPAEEKQEKVENNVFDDSGSLVSEGEGQSKTVIFDDSDDEIFGNSIGNSKKSASSLLYRQSPPLLPEETEKNFSKKQEPEIVQVSESKPVNLDGEPKKSHDIDNNQQKFKPDKSQGESKEEVINKEIKPKKKPPIGGVSVFGSGGMGGSELFAKVRQRKSMLAPESDSSEEDTPTEPTANSKPITPSEEKGTAVAEPVMPVSPVSPLCPISPVFTSKQHESKPGGEESSVSFEDPATHSNVLQSLNKTRARGSLKRRPPSRAHRKGGAERSDPSDAQDASSTTETPSPASVMVCDLEHPHITATDVSKTEPVQIQPGERLQHPSTGKGQTKVPVDAEQNEVESASTDMQTITSSKGSNYTEDIIKPVDNSPEKNKEVPPADNMDVLNAPKSALGVSETSSNQNSSLFGGSDSDEDLFGEVKQKQDVKKPLVSSGATSVPKMASKNSKSHSLFDDDDDDASIFSSKSQIKKGTTSASRNVPITKPKGSLKQSSEPFEDPLLGSLTK